MLSLGQLVLSHYWQARYEIHKLFCWSGILPCQATQYGDPETVQLLLEHGADVSYLETKGKTAYYLASYKVKRHPVYAKLLFKTPPAQC